MTPPASDPGPLSASDPEILQSLFAFIPNFEQGEFKESSSLYITTGEYPPAARDLQNKLKASGLTLPNFDWLTWVDNARPYLQQPETLQAASLDDMKKLITVAAHADQFNKSLFPHLCASGFMHQLLLRMRTLLTQ